jgi:hypothetical protein
VTAVDEDVLDVAAMSVDDLRAEAASRRAAEADLHASAREIRERAEDEDRAADQCGHEARLLTAAAVAKEALNGARSDLAGAKANAEGLLVERRTAEDTYLKAKRNHDRRQAEQKRLEGRAGAFADRDDAAVRTSHAATSLAEETPKRDGAVARHEQAERDVTACELAVSQAETAFAAAAWWAENPGPAPRTQPGMTDAEKTLFAQVMIANVLQNSRQAPPARMDEALRDQTRMRAVPDRGNGTIIPPANWVVEQQLARP